MQVPKDRRYSKEHEWALVEPDGTVRVGISEFAEHELGDVVYIELPSVGAQVKQFEQMGEIESVKAVSELFSPISGEVVEVNGEVVKSPELVNTNPYDRGWLVRVRVGNPDEVNALLDAGQYESLIS